MATIALIQNLFKALNTDKPERISGFARQLHDRFYEVLVDESGHVIQRAESLDAYQAAGYDNSADIVICSPLPEVGNLAPGFAELARIQETFGETPIIVWSNREEAAAKDTVLNDFGAAAYYTGTLLEAPDDIADLVLDFTG